MGGSQKKCGNFLPLAHNFLSWTMFKSTVSNKTKNTHAYCIKTTSHWTLNEKRTNPKVWMWKQTTHYIYLVFVCKCRPWSSIHCLSAYYAWPFVCVKCSKRTHLLYNLSLYKYGPKLPWRLGLFDLQKLWSKSSISMDN